jgi:hypothetical protein
MRRQGLVWLAAAVLALGAAACFSDPTKSLRAGATRLSLAQNTLVLHTGDSASVQGLVYDDQGNQGTMTGAVWSTADPTTATVRADSANPIPNDVYTRGVIKGIAVDGGVTTVVLTLGSLTDTLRVTVLPAALQGAVNVIGTAGKDTVVASPAPIDTFTAGDTVVVNSTANMTFTGTSTLQFGPFVGYLLARSPTQLKAMSRQPFHGNVTVTNVTFAGNAQTGPIAVASVNTAANVRVEHARFRGTITAAANALLGAGTNTIIVTAPAGVTVDTLSAGVVGKAVKGVTDTVRTLLNATTTAGSTITLVNDIPADTVHGDVLVTNVLVGGVRVDSMRLVAPLNLGPVARATLFPGAVTILGAGNQLDTIVVKGNGLANLGGASTITVNGVKALIVSQTYDSLRVIASKSGAGTPTVIFNFGQTPDTLAAQAPLTVNAATGEANEPGNDVGTTAPTVTITGSTAANPARLFGAIVSGAADSVDYYKITTVATDTLTVSLSFAGSGAGGATNPKMDLRVCTDVACATPIAAPTNAVAVSPGGAITSTANPKTITATTLAAGTYYIKVTGANTGGAVFSYRLTIHQ